LSGDAVENLERETGVEPATSTLARSRSTTELLPLDESIIDEAIRSGNGDDAGVAQPAQGFKLAIMPLRVKH
jgi:hypothetical protein